MERGLPGLELLEHDEVHPVGVDLEGHRHGLPTKAPTDGVDHGGHPGHDVGEHLVGFGIGCADQRRLQRTSPQAHALGEEEQHVELGGDVGGALQNAIAAPKDLVQAPVLPPRRVRRGQPPRPVALAPHLVPRVGHRRQAEEAGVECFLEPRLHLRQLGSGRALFGVDRASQPHHRRAQIGVAEKTRDVGTERSILEPFDVRGCGVPRLVLVQRRDDVLTRSGLDA